LNYSGHFSVIYDKGYQRSVYIDGREMAPHTMTKSVYENLTRHDGASLPVNLFMHTI